MTHKHTYKTNNRSHRWPKNILSLLFSFSFKTFEFLPILRHGYTDSDVAWLRSIRIPSCGCRRPKSNKKYNFNQIKQNFFLLALIYRSKKKVNNYWPVLKEFRTEICFEYIRKKSKKLFDFWEFRRNFGFRFSCGAFLGSWINFRAERGSARPW